MARRKKDGRRATGIYAKKGHLYIVTSQNVIQDGKKKYVKKWEATGLTDTTDNVQLAIDIRNKQLTHNQNVQQLDTNILMPELILLFLEKKKRILSDTTYATYCYRTNTISKYFEFIKVTDVTVEHINTFLDYLCEKKN